MGAGADADEVAETPVIEVMPRRATGLGICRDFVLRVTVLGQQRLAGFLYVPQGVVFRQHRRLIPEHRVRLQRQLIPGNVRRLQRNGLAQIAQGIVQRLIGQTVHQVEVEVIEPGLPRHARRTHGFVTVVDAAKGLKLLLLKALDTDR